MQLPWPNQRFAQQVSDIMSKVEIALLASHYDVDVEIQKERTQCTVTASIKKDDPQVCDNLLHEAQMALLSGAQQSTCVYLLGYAQQPFLSVTDGFQATLGEAQDEASAWQGPASMMMFTMILRSKE
jgi:hypothetical protein